MTPHANEVHVAWAGLLLLVVLGAVTITAIILLARQRWGRVVLGSLLLVALAVGLLHSLGVNTLHRVRSLDHSARELTSREIEAYEGPNNVHSPATAEPVGWDADLEKKFTPNVYSTERLAVAGLGRGLIDEAFLDTLNNDQDAGETLLESPGHVPADERVTLTVYTDDRAYFEALKPLVRLDPRVREIRLRSAHEAPTLAELDPRNMAMGFHTLQEVSTEGGARKILTGFLLYRGHEVEKTVRFVDRAWLEQLHASGGRFTVTWQTDSHQIIAGSSVLVEDPALTRTVAIDQAKGMVLDLVYEQLRDTRPLGDWDTVTLPRNVAKFIERTITEPDQWKRSSAAKPLLEDSFTQRFDRDYGTVYRTAVHVEVTQPLLDTFVQMALQHEKNQRHTWIVKGVSLAAMFLLIVLTYTFLNAATKGYFRAWLIGGSLAVIVVGMCVVLFVA